jgi:formate hydrogenlyase subunit 3/multisubunit Na+/H+ antiporter MnhD subunit
VAIAFSVPDAAGVIAGLALALHHMLAKPALFLLTEPWAGPLARLEGAARTSRLGAGLFTLLALSLIGIPPLPGFWAKFLLLRAAMGMDHAFYIIAAVAVLAATVVEAAYLLRIVRSLYRGGHAAPIPSQAPALAKCDLAPVMALCTTLLIATLLIAPLGAGLARVAGQAADVGRYVQTVNPLKYDVPRDVPHVPRSAGGAP